MLLIVFEVAKEVGEVRSARAGRGIEVLDLLVLHVDDREAPVGVVNVLGKEDLVVGEQITRIAGPPLDLRVIVAVVVVEELADEKRAKEPILPAFLSLGRRCCHQGIVPLLEQLKEEIDHLVIQPHTGGTRLTTTSAFSPCRNNRRISSCSSSVRGATSAFKV
jgi:hypothetical protein